MKILYENKQLNEGPGAGYTVSGTLSNVKVNKIEFINTVDKNSDLIEYEVGLDASADFEDVSANSYYYGGTIKSTPVAIDRVRLEFDSGDITEDDVKWAINGAKIEANLGGGWSHSTFKGNIEVDYMSIENASSLLAISMEMLDEKAITYLDKAVQNENTETQFGVVEGNWVEASFDTEDEAIQYAKENGYEAVQELYVLLDMDGDEVDTEFGDIVWTNGEMEESVRKPLTENVNDEERIPALAAYLNIPEDEIENLWDYEYQTSEGDYLVVTEEEAEELAKEDIRNLFDDMGLDSFTPGFRDWIIMNALDNDWFEDAIREDFENYVEDIEYEASSMGYDNRLIEEMHDHQVLSDDDFEEDEDGMPNLRELKEGVDIDSLKEEFIDLLVENAGDPVEYCADNFGWDWVTQVATEHNLIDLDEVVEQCIYDDGIAHFIARYDGEEIELGNGLYAYRTN